MLDINLKVKFNLNSKEELAGEIINLPEQGWTVPKQTEAVSEIERLIEIPIRYLHIPCTSGIWPPTKSLDDLVSRVINLIGYGITFSKPVSIPIEAETNFYVTYNGLRGKLKHTFTKDAYCVIFRNHQNEVVPEIKKPLDSLLLNQLIFLMQKNQLICIGH
jgi:hypothetical protein